MQLLMLERAAGACKRVEKGGELFGPRKERGGGGGRWAQVGTQ